MQTCPHCGFQNANGRTTCKSCRKEIGAGSWQETVDKAKAAYDEALAKLTADPTNAMMKQEALALGRHYSGLTRQGAITVYDEMALMNDINAASAAGAASAPASIEERLRKLNDLKTKGLITEQEYNERRTKLLDEV